MLLLVLLLWLLGGLAMFVVGVVLIVKSIHLKPAGAGETTVPNLSFDWGRLAGGVGLALGGSWLLRKLFK
jgi:hypothetical protein